MESVKIEWLGHASFLIKAEGKRIYIDPYEGEYGEKGEIILVTHSHSDHCDPDKIEMIRKEGTTIFAPLDCLSKVGGRVKSLKPGERAVVEGVAVEAVQAYNHKRFRSPGVPYHQKGLGVGYLITVKGKTIYHAGDTDPIPEMRDLKSRSIDLALLPSGGTYTMDNADAAEAALVISPKAVIPMHRWDTSPEEFKRSVEAKSQIQVAVLKPGESFTIR